MSITVSAVKARQNLGELLNLVSIKHEEVIIERAGRKIARLTAVDDGSVGEPAAEAYAARGAAAKKKKNDLSEFAGTWDEEEHRRVTAAAGSLRTIDPEMWK